MGRVFAHYAIRTGLLIAWIASLGCATDYDRDRIVDPPPDASSSDSDDAARRRRLGARNTAALDRYSALEWRFNRSDREAPPRLCLALSGGGVRSASFSIGVLAGLQDLDLLERIDLMSAVSGGSYAMSWYVLLRAREPELEADEIFRPDGAPQEQVAEFTGQMSQSINGLAAWTVLYSPFEFLYNFVMDLRADSAVARAQYRRGILLSYHMPLMDDWSSFRQAMGVAFLQRSPAVSEFSPRVLERSSLPLFLFNLTAQIDGYRGSDEQPLTDVVFEMSPVSMGSDYYGHYRGVPPLTLVKVTALSGAAVDAERRDARALGWIPRLLGTNLGMDLQSYRLSSGTRRLHRVMPWPTYYFHHYRRDRDGVSIYLTDGGHSENLGTFSLIRRSCDHIIVSDAEHDPDDAFVGYRKLQEAVREELGGELRVPEIEVAIRSGARLSGAQRVFDGRVSGLPMEEGGERGLRITYIKLGMDRGRPEQYPEAVRSYLEVGGSGGFPQEPTWFLSYSPDQFRAYRDLGRHVVTTQLPSVWESP